MRIYDTLLSDDDVLYLYTNGAEGTDPGTDNLKGYWKCNEGSCSTVTDYSIYGNDGTLNAPLANNENWEREIPAQQDGYSPVFSGSIAVKHPAGLFNGSATNINFAPIASPHSIRVYKGYATIPTTSAIIDFNVLDAVNLITNGTFDDASDWEFNGNWSFETNHARHEVLGGQHLLDYTGSLTLVNGTSYKVSWNLANNLGGEVRPIIGGTSGVAVGGEGLFEQTLTAGTGALLQFRSTADLDIELDNVVLQLVDNIVTVSSYTIPDGLEDPSGTVSGNQIVFASTGNISNLVLSDGTTLTLYKDSLDYVGTNHGVSSGVTFDTYSLETSYGFGESPDGLTKVTAGVNESCLQYTSTIWTLIAAAAINPETHPYIFVNIGNSVYQSTPERQNGHFTGFSNTILPMTTYSGQFRRDERYDI